MKRHAFPILLIITFIFICQSLLQAKNPLSSASGVALKNGSFRSATFSMW